MRIEFEDIRVALGKNSILNGLSLTAEAGKITGIIGPNGSGKSTLIKTLFSIVPVSSGTVRLDERDILKMKRREIATNVGYVGQETSCLFDYKVREIISMGRYPHKKSKMDKKQIDAIIDEAISIMHLDKLADRSIQELSGGEKKMVYLARTIAQQVDCIVLDEPTNHLDIRHQLFIMDYLKNSGKTVLIAIHDLSLASMYCDKLYLIKDGKNVDSGAPLNVLNKENVYNVFDVHGSVILDKEGRCRFQLT